LKSKINLKNALQIKNEVKKLINTETILNLKLTSKIKKI
jgi:hypothetical protein